jgi:hypothetical protein
MQGTGIALLRLSGKLNMRLHIIQAWLFIRIASQMFLHNGIPTMNMRTIMLTMSI